MKRWLEKLKRFIYPFLKLTNNEKLPYYRSTGDFYLIPIFIRRLLSDQCFSEITILNFLPPEGDANGLLCSPTLAKIIKRSLHVMLKTFEVISGRKILLGTSFDVMAVKGAS